MRNAQHVAFQNLATGTACRLTSQHHAEQVLREAKRQNLLPSLAWQAFLCYVPWLFL